MNEINIVFCCDDVYADKLAVSAYSLLHNTQLPVNLYIIDCGISDKNKDLILSLKDFCSNLADIQFKKPERIKCFEEFPVTDNFSSAIFYRLAVHEIFPSLKRAIYLDCDVIVDADIAELWQMDLGKCSFGVLNDEGNFFLSEDIERRKKEAGITLNRTYMSSGVLLFDLEKFASEKILERVIDTIKNCHKKLACPEQDAMNICVREDEYVPIDPKFNFTPFAHLAKKRIKKGLKPVVIHFSCGKPWCFNRKVVDRFYNVGLFKYDLGFIKKYWEYSDKISLTGYCSESWKFTLRFLYKRFFGKIEYFVAKKIRNRILRFFRNIFIHQS